MTRSADPGVSRTRATGGDLPADAFQIVVFPAVVPAETSHTLVLRDRGLAFLTLGRIHRVLAERSSGGTTRGHWTNARTCLWRSLAEFKRLDERHALAPIDAPLREQARTEPAECEARLPEAIGPAPGLGNGCAQDCVGLRRVHRIRLSAGSQRSRVDRRAGGAGTRIPARDCRRFRPTPLCLLAETSDANRLFRNQPEHQWDARHLFRQVHATTRFLTHVLV